MAICCFSAQVVTSIFIRTNITYFNLKMFQTKHNLPFSFCCFSTHSCRNRSRSLFSSSYKHLIKKTWNENTILGVEALYCLLAEEDLETLFILLESWFWTPSRITRIYFSPWKHVSRYSRVDQVKFAEVNL